jgi:hypothetical protein
MRHWLFEPVRYYPHDLDVFRKPELTLPVDFAHDDWGDFDGAK